MLGLELIHVCKRGHCVITSHEYTRNYYITEKNKAAQNREHISLDILNIHISCAWLGEWNTHYDDVTMSLMASQITSLTIVNPTVYSGADKRKHQSSASLAFGRGIHRGPMNSPHKWPVTRKMFPFENVITKICIGISVYINIYNHVYVCLFISRYIISIFCWKIWLIYTEN